MLKQKKDGSWVIQTPADLDAAVEAIEEREQGIADLEQQMEEEFDYLTMKTEVNDLKQAVTAFMAAGKIAHVFRDGYKFTLIRRHSTKWNEGKLKKLLPKSMWLKVTNQVLDPHKLDDLVKQGKIDDKEIGEALERTPQKPYIQRFEYKEGQDREAAMAEELALRNAMSDKTKGAKRK